MPGKGIALRQFQQDPDHLSVQQLKIGGSIHIHFDQLAHDLIKQSCRQLISQALTPSVRLDALHDLGTLLPFSHI